MKHLVICILLTVLSLNLSAACDWKTIQKIEGGYRYSSECHIQVGKEIKENKLRIDLVDKLKKTITLKDLYIEKSNERVELWKEATYKIENRLIKHDKYARKNDWILFGGGILTTILTGWALGQLNN